MIAVIVVLCVALVWVLASRRLTRRSVTAPIVLTLAGLLLTAGPHPVITVDVDTSSVRTVVEITLALVLFADASTVGFGWFRTRWRWPAQLLLIGLPLTIAAGFLAAWAILPGLGLAAIGVVAAALAPTDAALGASVLEDDRIPGRIRQTINVESGLNDGLATPVVLLFIGLAGGEGGHVHFLLELAVAAAVGLVVGSVGGWALHVADQRRWSIREEEPVAALSLALLAYLASVELHGNGFIAAFVAGLAFGARLAHRESEPVLAFTRQVGLLLGFAVWFLFGAALLPMALHHLSWLVAVYAVLSLTVVRMVPVAIAMLGSHARAPTVAFLGWFGPRGLASIVFGVVVVEAAGLRHTPVLVTTITVTVALSVFVHGVSAAPLSHRYAAWHAANGSPMESAPADEQRWRHAPRHVG
jgi:NhaP-type Na+/H+ or K+/H+ antiporter